MAGRPGPRPRSGESAKIVTLRLTEAEIARWKAAAAGEVLSLSEYIRAAVERAIVSQSSE